MESAYVKEIKSRLKFSRPGGQINYKRSTKERAAAVLREIERVRTTGAK